jgi:hypothetical protein
MDVREMLQSVMNEKGVTFEKIKDKLVKEQYEGAEDLESLSGISKLKVFELIERIKKAKSK